MGTKSKNLGDIQNTKIQIYGRQTLMLVTSSRDFDLTKSHRRNAISPRTGLLRFSFSFYLVSNSLPSRNFCGHLPLLESCTLNNVYLLIFCPQYDSFRLPCLNICPTTFPFEWNGNVGKRTARVLNEPL